MPRKSTIDRLPSRIREELSRIIRSGDCTIDQIVEHLRSLGAQVSRSAVGRKVKSDAEEFEKYRQAQKIAEVWIAKLGEEPKGDVGRLLTEMLRTIAFGVQRQMLARLDDEDSPPVEIGEVMLAAKAVKDLATAQKTDATRELLIRRELASKVESAIEEATKREGLSKDAAQLIRDALSGKSDG